MTSPDTRLPNGPDGRPAIEALAAPSIGHLELAERVRFPLQAMIETVQAVAGVVWLPEPTRGDLVARTCVGIDLETLRRDRYPLGDGLIGTVARDGRPAVVRDVAADPDATHRPLRDRGVGAVVALPLIDGGRVLGVVHVEFARPRHLADDEVHRLAVIADHIAAVAETERLYDESLARTAELERVNAELRAVDRLKGDFLSMVSHELRTPLTAVIGYTDLLLRQVHGPLTERQEQHQRAVSKAAHRLLQLINDLLDVTRLESGQVDLNVQDVPLAGVFDRALAQLQGSAGERQIELRLDVPTNLPSVQADPDRLHQVLVNLLDNAIKFTPPGGTVTLRADHRDGAAHVSVVDTGIGVPPEHLERIWDRFHQADSSMRRRFGGTGLGLAIVRNLVELHQGRVRAHSHGPGGGSTFCFALPLGDAEATTADERPSRPGLGEAAATGRRRVLIVDDEPDNREVIASIVGDLLGHQPVLAEDGEEGLRLADDRPDLILLDLRLPRLDGFEVARRLKVAARTADIPIVAISALADRDDQEAAYAAGCVGWVGKPFTPAGLGDAIQRALATAERV